MFDPKSEIIKTAFKLGQDFSKMISENKQNQFFGLIICDSETLFEEAFLVGCYKNHPISTNYIDPECDQKSRMDLFVNLLQDYGKRTDLTISYKDTSVIKAIRFDFCEVEENLSGIGNNYKRIKLFQEPKKNRDKKISKWEKNGRRSDSKPSFPTNYIEINDDPTKSSISNVLNYYLTGDTLKQIDDENYNRLGLVERSTTKIFKLLELPQPGKSDAQDETMMVKGLKGGTLQLWKTYGYWENPQSGILSLGLIDGKKNTWSLARLFNCNVDSITDIPIKSPFGEIVFAGNIKNEISNKKIIILNGKKAFEKIDMIKCSLGEGGIVLIISMNDIFNFGVERFRDKIRNYLRFYPFRYCASFEIIPSPNFKLKNFYWAKFQPTAVSENSSPDQIIPDLTVNLVKLDCKDKTALIALRKIIANLLPQDQNQGRNNYWFIWDIYNRLFRGGSYDIGNLPCYDDFQNELSTNNLSEKWYEIWNSKGTHPYNDLIEKLPDSDSENPYGMLTRFHGSPVKGSDEVATTVFKQIKNQKLVLIKSQKELKDHKGNLLVLGKAPEKYLEKILKSGFNGTIFQIALGKDCNLKIEVDHLNNLAHLDQHDENFTWCLPIWIKLIENIEKSTFDQFPKQLDVDDAVAFETEEPGYSRPKNFESTQEAYFANNFDIEELDIADYFEKKNKDDISELDESESIFTSTSSVDYKITSKQITFFSENHPFLLKFGTPEIGDIAILPVDEENLRRSIMNVPENFNIEFQAQNDLWKRALQNWIRRAETQGVIDTMNQRFNSADINRYKNLDAKEPGAPDNKEDFVYLINNIKVYGLFDFGGEAKMREFDASMHWDKILQKRIINQSIGRDFYEIIHSHLCKKLNAPPVINSEIQVNLFNGINGLFTSIKINEIS